ncbi:ribbon-helix-helix domain-containing protein [Nostoc sp.]|uniref:ribbon-helix-helix domain-containing protein n=1 Tax=Nostoc sp. TaxID=1180 RepID=UPI002FF4D7DE
MMDWRQILIELMSQSDRVQTSIYFPKDIHEALVRWAEEEDRPISNLVVRIVSKAVEERDKKQNPPPN